MIPGMRGMDPRAMQRMMKQMGMETEEIPATKVTFELENGNKLVIGDPKVTAMTMQGQKTYTVMGTASEEAGKKEIPTEDIAMVVDATGKSKKEAQKALEEHDGDIAAAITDLKE
jgi:nascent polypeptide-associated complex subunit alpha